MSRCIRDWESNLSLKYNALYGEIVLDVWMNAYLTLSLFIR
jgi:hypothetical protein